MAEASTYKGSIAAERNLPHGAYNALAVNQNPKKQARDALTANPLNLLKEELYKKNTPDIFDMKTEWNAIVLKTVDSINVFNNPLTIALRPIADITGEDKVKFFGRIPEIHGCLLTPVDEKDILALSQYPIFEGAAALGVPIAGDIVRVTFDNLNNFSGPKYIGPASGRGTIVGLGTAEAQNSGEAFNNGPRGRRTNVPEVYDLNTDPNRTGHVVGKGTTSPGIWPRDLKLIEMMKGKFPYALYDRARARGFSTDLVPVNAINVDQHLNVYLSVACAEVIEQYWRQQYSDATVRIIFNVRNSARDRNNSHGIGAAIDFVVHQGGTTIPVLQTWAALTRLGKAGRFPMGGRGLYLNTSANGIKGIKPEEAGEASPGQGQHASSLPQGGSAGIHYDWRDSFGNQRGPSGGKPNFWVSTDIKGKDPGSLGDGHDEYELGQWQTIKKGDMEAGAPLLRDNSNIKPGYTPEEAHKDYVKIYLGNKLPEVFKYWRQQGLGDHNLPEVGPKVFNILQVLELEQ